MPVIEKKFFMWAIENISKFGDTDVFPLPVENHVLFDEKDKISDLLCDVSNNFEERLTVKGPINHQGLAPVGYNGFRWVTQIDPIWNAYFLGAVLSLAKKIEENRIPISEKVVFSHRLEDGNPRLFRNDAWKDFQNTSASLAEEHHYVVIVDIADFYGRIYHHRLENELKFLSDRNDVVKHIMKLLMAFSNQTSYGIPIGGPASRILSEVLLNSVDKLLLNSTIPFKFVRYADDYRFFVDDIASAQKVIGFLSEKLHRNEGLTLQRAKTRILKSSEYLSMNEVEGAKSNSAEILLNLNLYYDPYSPTADEDYELLKDQLGELDFLSLLAEELSKGRINQALSKKLIRVLKHMPNSVQVQAIHSLIDNLDTLSPILPNVLRAIRDSVGNLDEVEQNKIQHRIRELIESNRYVTQVEVNLAFMVRILGKTKSIENARFLARLFDNPPGFGGSPSPVIQRDVLLILSNWDERHVIHDKKSSHSTMHPWVQRAFLMSSYCLGDEGSHWRKAQKFSGFNKIVQDWVSSRVGINDWMLPL